MALLHFNFFWVGVEVEGSENMAVCSHCHFLSIFGLEGKEG